MHAISSQMLQGPILHCAGALHGCIGFSLSLLKGCAVYKACVVAYSFRVLDSWGEVPMSAGPTAR